MDTHFAPPERADEPLLKDEIKAVTNSSILDGLMHLAGGLVAVLNEHRQIIGLNQTLLEALDIGDAKEVFGLRPGEAIGCIHAQEMPGGCGTSEHCPTCGAVIAIVSSLATNQAATKKCAISIRKNSHVDDMFFNVSACPVHVQDHRVILLFLHNITEQQKWAALERSFFHDINNIVMGLLGLSELLAMDSGETSDEGPHEIHHLAQRLAKEIAIQNCLAREDICTYNPVMNRYPVSQIVNNAKHLFSGHKAARNKKLEFTSPNNGLYIRTDLILLERVLNNMIVNALEASEEGDVVRVKANAVPGLVTFGVWNRQHINPQVAKRVFQRNFSTKQDTGRGLGTYSMKLFGEQYLGGAVDFTSSIEDGTEFRFTLPA